MERTEWRTAGRWLVRVAVWGMLPLVLGLVLAPLLVPVPKVGVIRFSDVIWDGSIPYVGEMIDHVLRDGTIRAVVLEIDSPGGDVTATEEIYYRLLQLREHKPLVVTVDYLAASGGYYMAAAGDYIYAKPASLVGNVGVISFLPPVDQQRYTDEDYISTGPFKFSGGSRGDRVRQIELAKAGFLESVFAQRGDRLQIDREALSSGEIFMGLQAKRMGLVDDLGANSEALQKAADLAQLRDYRVVDVNQTVYADWEEGVMAWGDQPIASALSNRDPAWQRRLYYLYLEPQTRRP